MPEDQQDNNDTNESDGKLFFTTSDLLHKMNDSISDVVPDAKFELHVKDPTTGTSVKADDKQVNRADLESKIKQSASIVQGMSPEEKLEWAEAQRIEGNSLFNAGNFKEAMDVYVTCLVGGDIKISDSTKAEQLDMDLKLPVLLNLALCALKLREFSKAEQFCSLALDLKEGSKHVKLWYRRGKARMGRGSYSAAREDFRKALSCSACSKANETDIRRELRRLSQLERASRSSLQKQKKAMQALLGCNVDNDEILSNNLSTKTNKALYDDFHQKRTFSTLTDNPDNDRNIIDEKPANRLSVIVAWLLSSLYDCLKFLFSERRKLD